ncbi:MAG: undecaprenyldiphospho-muramoylpentapeptide beta-N-acetylglucosaminyltransferase [Sulfobacillus acidophilus]|uniref:UDP-N-acetylglucosamine--N-acetylmuramyl-(pentapeptide) pyrophosphoryl-undecaprenol N-acetylglucosamine transferase n=1 Tax=Sulfobacillus acidophilus TaxID=53633 RepID=A0A2T2WEL7_9FIRM|nr:MAG: undecaprenyldiphospho-muramoylpentapeptide beta-N-acetylglucosaminyltransferase [Sulfobacillus acidophilus]
MRVLVSGGGSGGHIYPALAIASRLSAIDPTTKILYVGTDHGLERDLVAHAHIAFEAIHARGLLVKGISGKAAGALTAVQGLIEAVNIVRKFNPDVVVGTGGYVSGPVGLAANFLRVPLIIQEQNAWPGLTNRSLAKRARAVFVPFEEATQYFPKGSRVVLAGNPVEPPLPMDQKTAREKLGLDPAVRLMMATGGSQGAEAVNALMIDLLPEVLRDRHLGMIWATGKRYYESVMALVQRKFGTAVDPNRTRIVEYFYEITTVYRAADLFVGRAGAMTLTDCLAFGLPMVLIPSPHVSEDHQTKNAKAVVGRGAGMLLPESDLPRRRHEVLALLNDPKRLAEMGQQAADWFDGTALERIVQTVYEAGGNSQGVRR